MNKQQFATLAIGIKSAYPASKILEDKASMDFWYMTLKDIPYEIAENAVMEHICTNIYPPNIAEIRKLCMERCKTPILSFDEAWGVVQKAMSDYGWYHPQEAFATMDELTLAVVKNLGWSRLCQSENPTAERANFREAYEKKAAEAQNTNALPDFVAKNKVLLQKQYVPAIEKKEPVRIEQEKEPEPKPLTEEQREERARKFEEICFKLRLLPYATYNFPILFSNLPVVPVGQHFLLSCSTSHSGSFFKWCHKMKPACFEFVSIKSKAVSEDVSHNCNFLFWCVSIH